jgi:hypothetical protein
MAIIKAVLTSEFTRNFRRYRMQAQRSVVAVSNHGQITGYFIGPEEYEAYKRFKESHRSFATIELAEAKVREIAATGMDERHDHLNALLDRK